MLLSLMGGVTNKHQLDMGAMDSSIEHGVASIFRCAASA